MSNFIYMRPGNFIIMHRYNEKNQQIEEEHRVEAVGEKLRQTDTR